MLMVIISPTLAENGQKPGEAGSRTVTRGNEGAEQGGAWQSLFTLLLAARTCLFTATTASHVQRCLWYVSHTFLFLQERSQNFEENNPTLYNAVQKMHGQ